jgi:hypothetical protein
MDGGFFDVSFGHYRLVGDDFKEAPFWVMS